VLLCTKPNPGSNCPDDNNLRTEGVFSSNLNLLEQCYGQCMNLLNPFSYKSLLFDFSGFMGLLSIHLVHSNKPSGPRGPQIKEVSEFVWK
jgi:hypothetical protein